MCMCKDSIWILENKDLVLTILVIIMISEEQKKLANYIKKVHLSLRTRSRQIGFEQAWQEHLQDEQVLQNYAVAMKKLAEDYWAINNDVEAKKKLCRIEWVVNYIIMYFEKGLFQKEIDKELKKMDLFLKKELISVEQFEAYQTNDFKGSARPPYKLLDVGSCYNPFGKFNFLEVYPVDLYPAIKEVKKCNFLNTKIENVETNWFRDDLDKLPASYFDIVVFSLFLEYLPSPNQRFLACSKAYECLKTNGILLIITPDSKHESANAQIMKNWKISAAFLGFFRVNLEKLKHLYCMAFRKSAFKNYSLIVNNIEITEFNLGNMFIIPQDSTEYKVEKRNSFEKIIPDREMFRELPFA